MNENLTCNTCITFDLSGFAVKLNAEMSQGSAVADLKRDVELFCSSSLNATMKKLLKSVHGYCNKYECTTDPERVCALCNSCNSWLLQVMRAPLPFLLP